MEKKQKPT